MEDNFKFLNSVPTGADTEENISFRKEKERRIKKLSGMLAIYKIDLKRPVTNFELSLYDDYVNQKISLDEYINRYTDFLYKNQHELEEQDDSFRNTEKEYTLSKKEAKELIKR